ncbi:MAG TPA: oligopeptide:H+ symporter [Gammaproteobacteria bacterium]|nr:oligopeptide:H+ symporter [Gammaproteobacteria bacterium]
MQELPRLNTSAQVKRGAFALLFTQLFATLSLGVLYSTLVLYTTHALHLPNATATALTGSFLAINYAAHLLGGYCGGRFISYRVLFILAMLLQIVSCVLIAVPNITQLYWGLSLFLVGAGMNITCINCLLTQLFAPEDQRREGAFLWNYSALCMGFLLGFILSGYFELRADYHNLFLITASGNVIALIIAAFNWNTLRDRNTFLSHKPIHMRFCNALIGVSLITTIILLLPTLLQHVLLTRNLVLILGILMLFNIVRIARKQNDLAVKNKIWGYLTLTILSIIFWTLYLFMPMGLNLFIEHNVNRQLFGLKIAPQWALGINSTIVIIGGPVLNYIFSRLRRRGLNISLPLQFTCSLLFIGLSFLILTLGIQLADSHGYSSFIWIALCYVLQSLGELCISPIGFAMIGYLAPVASQGVFMATWMLMTGVAAILASFFSNIALGSTGSNNPLVTNPSFSHIFSWLGWCAIGAGVILALLTRQVLMWTTTKEVKALKIW